MNTKALKTVACACFANAFCCSLAHADLANCIVYRGGDSALEGDAWDECATSIIDAHNGADESDIDFVFVLTIHPSRPDVSYTITPIRLVIGESWTLTGYKITARDIEGIQNGVAEIVKAFNALDAGVIYHLAGGEREEPVETPRTRE